MHSGDVFSGRACRTRTALDRGGWNWAGGCCKLLRGSPASVQLNQGDSPEQASQQHDDVCQRSSGVNSRENGRHEKVVMSDDGENGDV